MRNNPQRGKVKETSVQFYLDSSIIAKLIPASVRDPTDSIGSQSQLHRKVKFAGSAMKWVTLITLYIDPETWAAALLFGPNFKKHFPGVT